MWIKWIPLLIWKMYYRPDNVSYVLKYCDRVALWSDTAKDVQHGRYNCRHQISAKG